MRSISAFARAALVALALVGSAFAAPTSAAPAGATKAVAYLRSAQNADGGIANMPGGASSPGMAAWAAIGFAAAGLDAGAQRASAGGATLGAYLETTAGASGSTGDAERAMLGLAATGRPIPSSLPERLAAVRRADGSYEGRVNTTSFAILALRAAGVAASAPAIRAGATFLAAQQNADGGFNFGGRGGPSGTDDTAGALQALVAAGRARSSKAVARAARWLVRAQRSDGGYPLGAGAASNAQSTAFAIQGLVAAGRDPGRRAKGRSRSALGFLRSLQGTDGAVRYSRTSRQTPVWVTAQALAALARRPLPVAPPPA
jgi:prenyltransferase beta subunit